MKNLLRRFARDTRGNFAIMGAGCMVLVFGIVVFGAYLTMVHGVQQLAAEAARSSVAGLSETERVSLAENYVTTNAASYPLLEADRLTVSAATSGSDVFVVTVNYDASDSVIFTLPFVPNVVSKLPFGL